MIPQDVIDRVPAAHDVVDVIGRAVALKRAGSSWKGCCPFHEDSTPSFDVNPERQTFKCFGCGKGGDVVTWTMERESLSFRDAVRSLAADKGVVIEVDGVASLPARVVAAPAPRRSAPPPVRPPESELAALWAACPLATEDSDVCAWLVSRGLDPESVASEVGVRAIPTGIRLPAWARGPGERGSIAWNVSGHRCAFPTYDATGRNVSVRARAVVPLADHQHKSLAPAGCAVKGLVLADVVGRQVLAGTPPDAWSGVVTVVEGEPDFLSWSTNRSTGGTLFAAVLGITSGAWTREVADRIPDATTVAIRTHADAAGQRYAAEVYATLSGRCDVRVLPGSHP